MTYISGPCFSTLYIIILSNIHLLCSVLLVTHGMNVVSNFRIFEYLTRQQENKTTVKLLGVLQSYISVFVLHCKYYLLLARDVVALLVNITYSVWNALKKERHSN